MSDVVTILARRLYQRVGFDWTSYGAAVEEIIKRTLEEDVLENHTAEISAGKVYHEKWPERCAHGYERPDACTWCSLGKIHDMFVARDVEIAAMREAANAFARGERTAVQLAAALNCEDPSAFAARTGGGNG